MKVSWNISRHYYFGGGGVWINPGLENSPKFKDFFLFACIQNEYISWKLLLDEISII